MGAHHGELDAGAFEVGGDRRLVQCPVGLGDLDEVVEFAREADLLSQRGDTALELQQPHRHGPASAGLADDEIRVGHRVVEEDLIELRGAGELLDRADRDARLIERHEQERQSGVALRARLAARDDEGPL